jgi:hypothetical protein
MGARILVRSHVRKYWKAMYGEIKGTNVIHRERTANLFLMAVVYSEVKNRIFNLIKKKKEKKY